MSLCRFRLDAVAHEKFQTHCIDHDISVSELLRDYVYKLVNYTPIRKKRYTTCPIKHGETVGVLNGEKKEPRLYRIWIDMKQRCYNTNNHAYPRYGGRGIRVCDEWKDDYGIFKEWAESNGYTDRLTIDRKNNDGEYSIDNCQWITKSENSKKAPVHHKKKLYGREKKYYYCDCGVDLFTLPPQDRTLHVQNCKNGRNR